MISNQSGDYPTQVAHVLNVLTENQLAFKVRVFDAPGHSASQAAALIGCPLEAIVKSLVFQQQPDGKFIMVLVSGKNRVDIDKLTALVAVQIAVAKAKTVKSETGYIVGAVPPFGIDAISKTVMDVDLTDHAHIWASAGALNMMMRLTPEDLCTLTKCQIADIKQR